MTDDMDRVADSDADEQGPTSNASVVRHDWTESGHPTVTLVEAVAAATDRTTTDLPSLYRSIDPDALDALVTAGPPAVTVAFQYADVAVSVTGNGTIEIRPDEGSTEERVE
jgi:hypothetical protein